MPDLIDRIAEKIEFLEHRPVVHGLPAAVRAGATPRPGRH